MTVYQIQNNFDQQFDWVSPTGVLNGVEIFQMAQHTWGELGWQRYEILQNGVRQGAPVLNPRFLERVTRH